MAIRPNYFRRECDKSILVRILPLRQQGEHEMLHQLIFTKLVGEIDYGAGAQGFGEFNAAGFVFTA